MSIEISYLEEVKRKCVHLSSLWMVAATLLFPYFFPEYGRWISCGVFAALLLLTLFSEHDYANNGRYLGRLYGILFGKMLRKEVHPGMWIVSGGYRIKFKRNPAARQALHDGLMDWKMLRTFRIVERVRLIKADKWPSRIPVIKRKGKKRGPKKKLRMKIAAFNRLKTDIAETYRNFKAEMDKYER